MGDAHGETTMWIGCSVCGASLMGEGADHGRMVDGHFVCPKCEHAAPHYHRLAEKNGNLDRRLTVLADAARAVVAEGGRDVLDGDDTAVVPAALVRRLAEALDYKGDVERFMTGAVLELQLVAEAACLFRRRHRQNNSTLDQLTKVREVVMAVLRFRYPDHDSLPDLSPEAVAKRLST
jgi:hypothetical protein